MRLEKYQAELAELYEARKGVQSRIAPNVQNPDYYRVIKRISYVRRCIEQCQKAVDAMNAIGARWSDEYCYYITAAGAFFNAQGKQVSIPKDGRLRSTSVHKVFADAWCECSMPSHESYRGYNRLCRIHSERVRVKNKGVARRAKIQKYLAHTNPSKG